MEKESPIERCPAAEAFTQLVLETFRLNGRLLVSGDRLTKPIGLSSALWQVLGAVSAGPATMAQIARRMGLTRQSVRRSVSVLIEKKYAVFRANPDHLRAQLVAMTSQGREALAKTTALQTAWANEVASDLSLEDLEKAVRVLKAVSERV